MRQVIKAYIDGELLSEHVVSVQSSTTRPEMDLREIRNFARHTDARAHCHLVIRPDRFESIDIELSRWGDRSIASVHVDEEKMITATFNGVRQEAIAADVRYPVLFDGPSILFDFANAFMILGLGSGEELRAPVNILDMRGAHLSTALYSFRRDDSIITILKGADPADDAEIVLDDKGTGPRTCRSRGVVYVFGEESRADS